MMSNRSRPRPSRDAPAFHTAGRYATEERLPLPAVDYWKPYAAFIGFAPTPDGPYALCECARGALANAIRLEREQADRPGREVNLAKRVPMWAATVPFPRLPSDPNEAAGRFRFTPRACHRCNMVAPERRWCHPMYGGSFKQGYGWYVSLNMFRFGVAPVSLRWLPDVVPPELELLLAPLSTQRGLTNSSKGLGERDKLRRDVEHFVEDVTRAEFGVDAIGEGWVSESLLAKIVAQLYPDEELVRHLRPDWLEGLELDIWLSGPRIAIEYQGQQHFHPIEAWGGADALRELQARDARKAKLCAELGVRLVTIDYTEPLTEAHVSTRLEEP
jgi:hypothetical protein